MRKLIVFLLCALALTSVCMAEVKVLTDANFDAEIKSSTPTLVKFYAPWCGHCKNLAPEFVKASEMVGEKAILAEVDCTVEKKVAEKYNIQGYPTLIIFQDGKELQKYEGERNAASIATFMKVLGGPAVHTITSAKELTDLIADGLPTAVLKVSSADSEGAKSFTAVAKELRTEVVFALVTSADIVPDVETDSVVVYRTAEEREVSNRPLTEAGIRKFVLSARVPLLGEVNPTTFKLYAQEDRAVAWLFQGKERDVALQKSLAPIAQKYRESVVFCWVDASVYGGVGKQMGLPEDVEYPAFAIDKDRTHYVHPTSEKLSADTVDAFVTKYLNNEVAPTVMSEPVPEKDTVDGLTTIVGETAEKYLKKGEKSVFVLFYAPWCGHCKKLHPEFEKLAKKMEAEDVIIAKLDATANDFDRKLFQVNGFPTMYLVPAGKAPIAFNGGRTAEDMEKFIKSHIGDDAASDL